jgi:hypothetical protein
MIATQKLIDDAYASAHVCADILEKISARPEKVGEVETTEWLFAESKNLFARANALHSRATGNKPETLAP